MTTATDDIGEEGARTLYEVIQEQASFNYAFHHVHSSHRGKPMPNVDVQVKKKHPECMKTLRNEPEMKNR